MRNLFRGPARQNAFGSLLIQGSQRLARLAVIVAAAALLTPTSFAALALVLALTDMVRGGLQAFDVDAVRRLSRGGERDVIQDSIDAKGVAGLAGLSLVAALAALIADVGTVRLVAVSGLGTLAASVATSFLVERQASLALRSVSARVATASLIGAALAVLLLWLTHSAISVVIGLAIGDGLLLALVCRAHAWQPPKWQPAIARVRQSRRLVIMQLAHIGQFRVGTIVLAAFGSAVAVGEYAIASRVAEGLVILAAALSSSSLPMMGAAHAQDERVGLTRVFGRSYNVGIRVVAPLVATLVITAPIWIRILFPRYPGVGPASAVVGLAVMIFFASSQTTALLNATHRDRAASRSAVGGLVVSVLASSAMVSLGAAGVAAGRVAGELVRLLMEAAAGRRELGIPLALLLRPWFAVTPILAGATIAVAAGWQGPYPWIAAVVALAGTAMVLRRSSIASGVPVA